MNVKRILKIVFAFLLRLRLRLAQRRARIASRAVGTTRKTDASAEFAERKEPDNG